MFQSRGCLSTMTSRIKRVKEILLPEPRYKVGAMMNDFPHKGRVYDGVLLNFFRSEITENGGGEDSYSWAADELFTEHEAEQLVEWLLEHFGDKVSDVVIEERRTLPREALPFGILGVLGILDDYWMLTFHPKWNLPFQAWAYYDLHGSRPRKFAYLEMTSDGDVRFYSVLRNGRLQCVSFALSWSQRKSSLHSMKLSASMWRNSRTGPAPGLTLRNLTFHSRTGRGCCPVLLLFTTRTFVCKAKLLDSVKHRW